MVAVTHVHGCGHPAAPIIMCDDCIFGIHEYMMWVEHHTDNEPDCQCFKCWLDKVKEGGKDEPDR